MTFPSLPRWFKVLRLGVLPFVCATAVAGLGGRAQAAPVFQVFELLPNRSAPSEVAFDERRPLLTVRSVQDVKADYVHSTVKVTLKENDTKAFASLSRQFTGRLLLLKSPGTAMEVMRITGPIEDGQFSFDPVNDLPMFEYLSGRFGLAPER